MAGLRTWRNHTQNSVAYSIASIHPTPNNVESNTGIRQIQKTPRQERLPAGQSQPAAAPFSGVPPEAAFQRLFREELAPGKPSAGTVPAEQGRAWEGALPQTPHFDAKFLPPKKPPHTEPHTRLT